MRVPVRKIEMFDARFNRDVIRYECSDGIMVQKHITFNFNDDYSEERSIYRLLIEMVKGGVRLRDIILLRLNSSDESTVYIGRG